MRVAVWLAGWQHLRVNVYLAAKDKKKKKKIKHIKPVSTAPSVGTPTRHVYLKIQL